MRLFARLQVSLTSFGRLEAAGVNEAFLPVVGGALTGLVAVAYPEILYQGFSNVNAILQVPSWPPFESLMRVLKIPLFLSYSSPYHARPSPRSSYVNLLHPYCAQLTLRLRQGADMSRISHNRAVPTYNKMVGGCRRVVGTFPPGFSCRSWA